MSEKVLCEFVLQDGKTKIIAEIDKPNDSGRQNIGRDDGAILEASTSFGQSLENVKLLAGEIVNKFSGLAKPAKEVEVKFGLKLTADCGVIFAAVGSEVNYEITLKWQNNGG